MIGTITKTFIITYLLIGGILFIIIFAALLLFETAIIILNITLTKIHETLAKIVDTIFNSLYKDFICHRK
jgi:hypothetical protein